MNMNFSLAFERLEGAGVQCERETVFRYDDTNPEAETKEFIACDLRVLRRFHAIGATCVHLTRSWVVSFSSLRQRCSAQVARDGRGVDGLVS